MLERLKLSTHMPVKLQFERFEEIAIKSENIILCLQLPVFMSKNSTCEFKRLRCYSNCIVLLMWNVFGDESQQDTFHDATPHLLGCVLLSPANENGDKPFALDIEARASECTGSFSFAEPTIPKIGWQLKIDTTQMLALCGTVAGVNALLSSVRKAISDQLETIANKQFGGLITRNMTPIVYIAKKS